ncbi:D-3-phosphoglycerate dehydrogenase [Anthonomus grandis grandis]|uniref:D-3-phosphoglycerate dehydrogenase n=1 Tax=Anthonomus grandis grandis TaxID=2921223 RepID=UPI002166AFD6|nr:D-3-phosphoglycerate dehydrogenase [Anthonomus grandis grandis]
MDIKKVLVADAVDDACIQLLKKYSIDVDCKYKLPKDALIEEIKNYDAVVVRSDTKITADVIKAGQKLKVIGRAGAGVDNIDVKAATENNVVVLNTPGGNAISACELTCSLITNLARNVTPASASLKAGRWDRKLYSGHELSGKTLAIIGLGRIGKEVATRMQAWGMETIGFDPIVSAEEAKKFNVEYLQLEQLWPRADYITVHTPLIPATRNLISAKTLASCKKGVRIINVARGGIVNEKDLLEAIKSGQCGGAGIDVFEQEPPTDPITLELIAHDKVVATPHLGASTTEAQIRVAVEVAEQIIALTGTTQDYTSTAGVLNPAVINKVKA